MDKNKPYLLNIRFNIKRFKERIMGKYLIISLIHSNKTSFKKNSENIQFDEIYFNKLILKRLKKLYNLVKYILRNE